jgi:short-subunit dehydrogenase
MVKQKSGKILNISSIAGLQAGPYYATYFASKAYVLLFTEALQIEYASDNINITALCPGVSKTSFFENANMRQDSKMFKFYLMNPNKVALAGYKGLNNNKKVVIPGFRNKIVSIGYRIMPRSIINRITKNLILKAAK